MAADGVEELLPCTCHSDDLEPYCPQHTPLSGESESAATCRNCGQPIIWARTEHGKKMPLNPDPVPDETQTDLFVLRDRGSGEGPLALAAWGLVGLEPHYRSHFATCESRLQPPQDPGWRYAGSKYRPMKR